jgi:hypothetical protein
MTSGAQTSDGLFIEVGWGFRGVPISSSLLLTSLVFFLAPGHSLDDAQDDS